MPSQVPGAVGCCQWPLGASQAASPAQSSCGLPRALPSGRTRAPSSAHAATRARWWREGWWVVSDPRGCWLLPAGVGGVARHAARRLPCKQPPAPLSGRRRCASRRGWWPVRLVALLSLSGSGGRSHAAGVLVALIGPQVHRRPRPALAAVRAAARTAVRPSVVHAPTWRGLVVGRLLRSGWRVEVSPWLVVVEVPGVCWLL